MVEGGGTAFPVIFFDGEREINIGNVRIQPKLEYKTFLLMLAQRIGISPYQISVYLVDRKNFKSPDDSQKFSITGNVNFALICREKDCCFLVVLKRSLDARTLKYMSLNDVIAHHDFAPGSHFSAPLPPFPLENLILLRRNQAPPAEVDFSALFYDRAAPAEIKRLETLRIQRENHAMSMAQPNLNPYAEPGAFPRMEEEAFSTCMTKNPVEKYYCEECTAARRTGQMATFHHCVNDSVVVGFKSTAGPIGRRRLF